jgi:hypothetical protein
VYDEQGLSKLTEVLNYDMYYAGPNSTIAFHFVFSLLTVVSLTYLCYVVHRVVVLGALHRSDDSVSEGESQHLAGWDAPRSLPGDTIKF